MAVITGEYHMGLLDDIKGQFTQKAEEVAKQVTDAIPGEVDDQIVEQVKGKLGLDTEGGGTEPASADTTAPTPPAGQ
jgi:hypothetical protein